VGNLARHAFRLWFYLSPGLYSLALLDSSEIFQANPILRTIAHANPMAVLFEAYRMVIYGTPEGAPGMPDWGALAEQAQARDAAERDAWLVLRPLVPAPLARAIERSR